VDRCVLWFSFNYIRSGIFGTVSSNRFASMHCACFIARPIDFMFTKHIDNLFNSNDPDQMHDTSYNVCDAHSLAVESAC
jgi:hypothetical protein